MLKAVVISFYSGYSAFVFAAGLKGLFDTLSAMAKPKWLSGTTR